MTVQIDPSQFEDPRWRLNNLYMVVDERGIARPFVPNTVQQKFIEDLHSRNIVLKSRKHGMTTLCCLIDLDACIFNPNTEAAIIAHKLGDAKKLFRSKIKWPYDQLPEQLKERCAAVNDSAETLSFANHSIITVSSSVRSGTPQYLHISEFAKLCAQFPERAQEVVTGSLNAVPLGGFITIESTAEGQDGPFYQMVQKAREAADRGQTLTELDYKFHFFAWYQDPRNVLDTEGVVLTEEDERYFAKLEGLGIELTRAQKNWYVKQEMTNEGAMKRENPSTPEESFEQALEGAYFEQQLAVANKHRRIGGYPYDPRYMVNTFWDLGRNDLNAIWLHQYIGGYHRFIDYYENSGEFISHYIKWLREWAEERQAVFGEHYMPHDSDKESLWLEDGTKGVMANLHFYPQTVDRPTNKIESINAARALFVRCQFDEAACSVGLRRLRAYRKEWDHIRGVWKDKPYHGPESNGADAFQTFACAPLTEEERLVAALKIDRHRRAMNRGRKRGWMAA